MRDLWQGPDVELVVEEAATTTAENAARTLPLLLERGVREAIVVCAPTHFLRARWIFRRIYGTGKVAVRFRLARIATDAGAIAWELGAIAVAARQVLLGAAPAMSDTLVFIPAWNEEANLPGVRDALRDALPDAAVLVVDDGSTDRTAEVASEHGAQVHSLGSNQGLRFGIAAGYPLRTRSRLRLLRSRRCRRPASGLRAEAPARARAHRSVRRRGGLALRLRRRVRAVPLRAEPFTPVRHGSAAARDARRPRSAVQRRDERACTRSTQGAAAARRAVHEP